MDIQDLADTMTIQVRPLGVCYLATYLQKYSRKQIMIDALRQARVEVIDCHELHWHRIGLGFLKYETIKEYQG